MTNESISSLLVFIRTRLDDDDELMDPVINDHLKVITDWLQWYWSRRTEPDFAIRILYHLGAIWSDHAEYRSDWKPLD